MLDITPNLSRNIRIQKINNQSCKYSSDKHYSISKQRKTMVSIKHVTGLLLKRYVECAVGKR